MIITKADRQGNRPQRILVVEDEENLRELYREVLSFAGFAVTTAEHGEAGWKLLRAMGRGENGYDLLITDNNMPKLSGIELFHRLRSAGVNLPVILISSEPQENARTSEFAAVLAKCFPMNRLVQTVRNVLSDSVASARADKLT